MHVHDYTDGTATDFDEEKALSTAKKQKYHEEKVVAVSIYKTALKVVSRWRRVEKKERLMVHHFIVLEMERRTESGERKTYYYSFEKYPKYLIEQKSNSKKQLKENLCGKPRERSADFLLRLEGWRVPASLYDVVQYLSDMRAFSEPYNILKRNCQHFVDYMINFLAATDQYASYMSSIVK